MTYRELLHAYKEGKLAKEKKEQVEQDIEKQEAISDYLVDRMEENWGDNNPNTNSVDKQSVKESDKASYEQEQKAQKETDVSQELTKKINHSIHRAFFKMGMIITTFLLVVILFLSFGLSPLIRTFYYDPTKIVATDDQNESTLNQISLDYMIYSNVTMPGYYRDLVNAESLGFGKYSIEICQTCSRTTQFTNVNGTINRGKLTLYNTNVLKKPFTNIFAGIGLSGEGTISQKVAQAKKDMELGENEQVSHWYYASKEEGQEALTELDAKKDYLGYVTFEKDMTFKEVQEFVQKLPENSWCEWYGINTSENHDYMPMGYFANSYSSGCNTWEKKNYPNLNIWEENNGKETTYQVVSERLSDEDWCKTHMTSMLKYLADQTHFLKMMGEEKTDYEEAASYVENHEPSYYGIVIGGKKADLEKVEKSEDVYGIYADEMR